MKILFTGKTDFKYNRVRILLKGLEQIENISVVLCPIDKRSPEFVKRFKTEQRDADIIYIPPFRHRDVKYIKRLTDKPVVFDPLISKYMTTGEDYGNRWKALLKYPQDRLAVSACDHLLTDTSAHKDYFSSKFGIRKSEVSVLPIGSDTSELYPVSKNIQDQFHVGFCGSFIPLQGVLKIAEAAHILKDEDDIVFDMIGTGSDYAAFVSLCSTYQLSNVNMLGHVNYNVLNEAINKFDVCLGIFGDSIKTDIVIPNKIWNYASINRCVITKDTQGIREVFEAGKNIILCDGSPEQIAEQILYLRDNPSRAQKIAQNAYDLICQQYNEVSIAQRFVDILRSIKA